MERTARRHPARKNVDTRVHDEAVINAIAYLVTLRREK